MVAKHLGGCLFFSARRARVALIAGITVLAMWKNQPRRSSQQEIYRLKL